MAEDRPLTLKEVKALYGITPLYVVFAHDGTDALIQENGYTLEDCKRFIARGDEIYID